MAPEKVPWAAATSSCGLVAYNAFMPLNPDDTICFCFHVSLRKIETFCAVERPQHASQISECLSAGTGCGWCVPMLERIHHRLCPNQLPWWRQSPAPPETNPRSNESVDAEAYKSGRKDYIKEGKGIPPAGAEQ